MIIHLAGSKSQHVAINYELLLALDCLQPQVFNWCQGSLHQVKVELTACKTWAQREFGYGTLIVSFILERVPLMRSRMSLGIVGPRMTSTKGWASLAPHTGGDQLNTFSRMTYSSGSVARS